MSLQASSAPIEGSAYCSEGTAGVNLTVGVLGYSCSSFYYWHNAFSGLDTDKLLNYHDVMCLGT